MARLKLHLDADVSIKALHAALLSRGHDVTRTPNEWMAEDASDETQLLGATAQGRCILTSDFKHYTLLARRYPQHAGIIFVTQRGWGLSRLLSALDRLLSETQADDLVGQIRWLNDWQ